MTRDQRRLAAIVSADVVGYSLLMGRDDSATLAGLKAHRRELIDPKIAEYGGRIVKTTGDGLLLEFPSVVDAVRCAVDVQRGMAERNTSVPHEQRIEFRIGINVGDIIIDGDDIFGDGVNVAARLQTLAEPGGICVSRVVRDQVLDKLSFAFQDLGAQQVKNIARPVEAYRVDLGTAALQTLSPGRKRWQRLTRALGRRWFAAGALALGLAGIAVWVLPQFWKTASEPPAPPLSVAILPLAAPAGGVAEKQFAEMLTQDLASSLGRSAHWARVVPSGQVAGYEGKPFDARAVGRALNVRYLVEGDVRGTDDRITVNARLVHAGSATQVWATRMEIGRAGMTQEQSALVAQMTTRLRNALFGVERTRADKVPAHGASAIEFVLHGDNVWNHNPASLSGAREASKFYDQALSLDGTLVPALLSKASTLHWEQFFDPHADHDRLVQELDDLTFRAINADNNDVGAWNFRATALGAQWRWDAALEAVDRARNLDPNRVSPISNRAELMVYMGRPNEALATVDQALTLSSADPLDLGWPWSSRCRADMALGRYEEAIAACEKSAAFLDWWMPHLYLVAAYNHQGETAKAETEKAKLLKQRPTASIADFMALKLSNVPAFWQQTEEHVFADLRKAGIPEK